MNAPVNALVGVFLNDNLPTSSGAPPGLDFRPSGLGTAFLTLNPALKQVFFIGDGRTGNGTGAVQQFIVPAGATRFFLGTVDGFGWNTNSGTFSVQVIAPGGAAGPLAAAILPSSRSVQVGVTATAGYFGYKSLQGNPVRAAAAMAVADKQSLPIETQVDFMLRGGNVTIRRLIFFWRQRSRW